MNKKGRFAEVAEGYNNLKLAIPHYNKIQRTTGKLLISNLKNSFPEKDYFLILEMGFGTGETTKQILVMADKAGVKIRIIAIDDEIEMLRVAKKKIKDYRASFILAEANEFITGQSQKYHGVVSGFMLHNLEKEQRADIINKSLQVLDPGGIFVNTDKIAQDDFIAHLKDLDKQLRAFDVFRDENDKYWAYWYKHYLDDDELKMTESELESLLKPRCRKVEFVERHVMDEICLAVRS
ncbi:MAG: class I SAM-dependent methyltransferase [Candidatus Doudnabacteria bacterium]